MKQRKMKKQRNAWLFAMIAGSLFCQIPGITYAEEMNEFALDQVVVTANRVPTKLSQAAANVTVINREQLENGHYNSLAEVLKHANGVEIRQQGFPGAEEYVRLNGDERVLILVDGRRMNLNKKPGHGQATYNLNVFPSLNNIERIEIVKGAASAIYGSDAVGGVINIITRKGGESSSTFEAGAGSWGFKRYELTTEGAEKSWNWFITAGKNEQDHSAYKDFKTGIVRDMPNSAYDQKNMTIRIDKELSDTTSLTFSAEHGDDHKGQPYNPPGYPLHNAIAYLNTITNNWDFTYNTDKTSEVPGYLRVYQNYHKYEMHGSDANPVYNNKETGFAWQDGWRLDDNNLLVGGVEWRNTRVQHTSLGDQEITNKAAYLEDRMQLGNKWVLTPGVRYDNHSTFGTKATPRASLNYQMDSTTDMYISWGKVFNAPLVDDLFWPEESSEYEENGTKRKSIVVGNTGLKPETGYTTTIGINKQLDKRTHVKASYFESKLHDAIDWGSYSYNDGGIPTTVYTPSNINELRKKGADIELRRTISPLWAVMAGYSYLHVEEKKGTAYTLDLENSQPNGYRLGFSYANDKWNVDLDGTGATGRSTARFSSSRYWIVDLAMNYSIDKNARAYFKVNNLTNQDYESVGDSNLGAFPMPARNYQLGMKYSF